MFNGEDLTGRVFGRLEVVSRAEDHIPPCGVPVRQWVCKCSCGNEIVTQGKALKDGTIKSCGCLRKETTAARNRARRKTNKYDLSGDYGVGYTSKGEPFWFDKSLFDAIKNHFWRYDTKGYVCTNLQRENGKRKSLMLHSIVMPNPPEGMIVDHIIHPKDTNGHKIDNRASNLRYVTASQNAQNTTPARKNNTSGHKGVSFSKRGCWKASIAVEGEHRTKYFAPDQFEQACNWYDEMAKMLHGKYRFNDDGGVRNE